MVCKITSKPLLPLPVQSTLLKQSLRSNANFLTDKFTDVTIPMVDATLVVDFLGAVAVVVDLEAVLATVVVVK